MFKIFQDSQISNIFQDSTIEDSLKTLGEANCFGPTRFYRNELKISSAFLMSGSVKHLGNVGFSK